MSKNKNYLAEFEHSTNLLLVYMYLRRWGERALSNNLLLVYLLRLVSSRLELGRRRRRHRSQVNVEYLAGEAGDFKTVQYLGLSSRHKLRMCE